jgi:hypothetical protein
MTDRFLLEKLGYVVAVAAAAAAAADRYLADLLGLYQ